MYYSNDPTFSNFRPVQHIHESRAHKNMVANLQNNKPYVYGLFNGQNTSINRDLKFKNDNRSLRVFNQNKLISEVHSVSNNENKKQTQKLSKNENLSVKILNENALNSSKIPFITNKNNYSNEELLDLELSNLQNPNYDRPYNNYPTMKSFKKFNFNSQTIKLNEIKNRHGQIFNPPIKKIVNPYSSESSFTEKYLRNLKSFLFTVFTYQTVSEDDIHLLSCGEKKILSNLINGKDYCLKENVIDNLYLKNNDYSLWHRFFKKKRKEENLKYGLKLIFKNMQNTFLKQNEINLSPNPLDGQILFYIYYFGELEFSMNCSQIQEAVDNGLITKNKIWKKLAKYVLPEMGLQSTFSCVKSINKHYLQNICKSKKFVSQAFHLLLDSIIFMSYCWNNDWENELYLKHLPLEEIGIQFLKTISNTNKKEILKLFKEWENQVIIKETYVDVGCSMSIKKSFEIIKMNAKRKNLKFPWTFKEIQNSLIECFLVLSEFINHNTSSPGRFLDFNFINNKILPMKIK